MVVSEEDGKLVLQSSDLRTSISIGLVCTAIAILILYFACRSGTLTCQHDAANHVACEVQQSWLFGVISRVPVADPQEAVVESTTSKRTVYRLAVVAPQGRVPLTTTYSSDSRAAVLARQFNEFLRDSSKKAITLSDPSSYWAPLIAGAIAVFVFLNGSSEKYVVDRSRGEVTLRHVGLTGVRVTRYPLGELSARLRRVKGARGDVFTVVLTLDGGRTVEIPWFGSNQSVAQATAERIQNFARPGVPVIGPDV